MLRYYLLPLLIIVVVLPACGSSSLVVSKSESNNDLTTQPGTNTTNAPVNSSSIEKKDELNSTQISRAELVRLTDKLDQIHRQVVDKIEANGWYTSINEIEPSPQEFEESIRPIVSPYFTDSFIEKEILEQMEAFFCYCDAPGPIQGSMKPDFVDDIKQTDSEVRFNAYRPANEINSGTKFSITLIREGGSWKINDWNQLINSHEESFQLTVEHIMKYYQNKNIDVVHIDTFKGLNDQDDIFLFEQERDGKWISVQSRDWYTAVGKEFIEQLYGK